MTAASRCDGCGEVVTDIDAGFSPGLQSMAHSCGGTWRVVSEASETLTPWTYEGYWLTVLGDAGPEQIVSDYDLTAGGLDDIGLDGRGGLYEWLNRAEQMACEADGIARPEGWDAYRERALRELSEAIESETAS